MANLPMICIVTDAHRTNINLVWAARGLGPESFTRRLCTPSGATTSTPPTHWLMSDAAATDGEVAICQAMANGDLPPLPEGVVWGRDGIIDSAAAMEAINGTNLHVYSVSGDVEPTVHAAAVLATEGLIFVPEPEV